MATAFPIEQLGWSVQLSEDASRPSEQPEVALLLAAVRAGEVEAFDKLMQLEERRVYRTALCLLGRPEDAEDAVQEIFLRVHRKLGSYDASRPWRSWLYVVSLNVCRDLGRRRRLRSWISLDAWRESGGPEPPAAGLLPDEQAENERRREILRQGMKRLSPREREALTLHAIEEVPAAEAAAILGVAEGTVRSLASRARTKLTEYVESRTGGAR
jgi:RNA polymerase sigma-70 factor (ECF subfamily)